MTSDTVHSIDATPNFHYGKYSLANYFLNCDVSNNENHRYLPISVIKPNNTIQKDEEEEEIRFENNFEL